MCADPKSAKKTDDLPVFFCAFVIWMCKSCSKRVGEIDPRLDNTDIYTNDNFFSAKTELLGSITDKLILLNFHQMIIFHQSFWVDSFVDLHENIDSCKYFKIKS